MSGIEMMVVQKYDDLFKEDEGVLYLFVFFFQAEGGIRSLVRSRGVGNVYKRQAVRMPCYISSYD